jgi:hypothetical protein
MEFICDAYSTLHVSWYAMVFVTVLPMVATISRSFAFMYLIIYAIVCVWVVMYGIIINTTTTTTGGNNNNNNYNPLVPFGATRMMTTMTSNNNKGMDDEKVFIFRKIKLQDP